MFLAICILSFIKPGNISELLHTDLYKLIGLEIGASQREITRSYKRFLVQKNRNKTPTEKTLKTWRKIESAYEILGNPDSKELYQEFGIYVFNKTGFSAFGYRSDFEIELIKARYKESRDTLANFGGIITYPIQFSLSDFLTGAQKKVKVIRTVTCVCPRGGTRCAKCRKNPMMEEVVKELVKLPPGAHENHRIYVKGLGDTHYGRGAENIVFIASSRNDSDFFRDGVNLIYNCTITLAQAIEGGEIEITNIDGETIKVPLGASIQHGDERRIVGKGLPYFESPKKRGDIIIKFSINFPERLTEEQKRIIENVLPIDLSEYE